jgi:hypothetical protein
MAKVIIKEVNLKEALSYRGTFPKNTKFDDLFSVFGLPDVPVISSGIDALWQGEIDGEAFTIYNYRTGKAHLGAKGLPVDKITEWNIGGFSPSVAQKLVDYFNDKIGKIANTTITVELSPEIYLALTSLCAFYRKDKAQVIEMAVENMAADSRLIVETFEAKIRKIAPEGEKQ